MKKQLTHWVGVRKDRYKNHEVFRAEYQAVTPENYPEYDYTIGPFTNKAAAIKRASEEKNLTGTFTDPFCNGGQGR